MGRLGMVSLNANVEDYASLTGDTRRARAGYCTSSICCSNGERRILRTKLTCKDVCDVCKHTLVWLSEEKVEETYRASISHKRTRDRLRFA